MGKVIRDTSVKIPFLPVFIFSYVGILLSGEDVLVISSVVFVFFILLLYLKLFDFIPLLSLIIVFALYTKNLSWSGKFIVGRVDSLSSNSILVSVDYVKNTIRETWRGAGGYVRIYGKDEIFSFDVYDKVVIYCSRIFETKPGWRFCPNLVFIERPETDRVYSFFKKIREKAMNLFGRDSEEKQILSSMLFGSREDIDQRFLYELSGFGILHLIAISGSHFTAVAFFGVFVATLIGKFIFRRFVSTRFQPYILKIIFSFVFQLIFLILCGFVRPAQRAFIMNTIFFVLYLMGGNFSALNSLFASVFFIILVNPFDVWNISFVLSFLAVLFILAFVEIGKNKIITVFWASVFASLGVLPVLINLGIPVSLVSPISNIIFTSLFDIAIIFGVAAIFLGFLFEPLAYLPVFLGEIVVKIIVFLVDVLHYMAIAVSPKVPIPYQLSATILFFFLLFLKSKLRKFFLPISLALYLLIPITLHFFTKEKIYTFSVFAIREVNTPEGKEFYILPLRKNISERQIEELKDILKNAKCVEFCFESEQSFKSCDNYSGCDFGNIRN